MTKKYPSYNSLPREASGYMDVCDWVKDFKTNYIECKNKFGKEIIDSYLKIKNISKPEKKTKSSEQETQNPFLFYSKDKKGNKLKPQVSVDKVCDYLLKKNNFKTIYSKIFETCFIFQNGIYVPIGREIIFSKCENILGSWCKNNIINEIFSKIKRQTVTPLEDTRKSPLHLIPLENGLYNLETQQLEEHNPNYFFIKQHPIIYSPKEGCPQFKKFVLEALPEEDLISLQEVFGFAFYRAYLLKKCFIFVGLKDTGKTVLLTVLSELVGTNNICGLPLETIASADRMRLYFLYDKTLNVYDDLNGRDISDAGGLKVATGGGLITAEEKFGDVIQFYNYAKLLFACNKIPVLKDVNDDAYYSRWMPYEFINIVPIEEQDPLLISKLSTEKQGIFNWALEGLLRLLKNKRFSYQKSEGEVKRIMQSGDPLIKFVSSALVQLDGSRISKDEMHQFYSFWSKHHKTTNFSISQLARSLPKACSYIIPMNDKNERYWLNASFNKSCDTFDTFKKNIYKIRVKDNNNVNKSLYVYKKEASKPSQTTLKDELTEPLPPKDISFEYQEVQK